LDGWRIQLLGELRAVRGAQVVTRFRTRKTGELLAYLSCYRRRMHPRELLIDLLWPEHDLDTGRRTLSVALSALRQQLDAPDPETAVPGGDAAASADADSVFVADRFSVGVNPARITTDVAEFEAALQAAAAARDAGERARWLAGAVELYGGALLPGYYADWLFPEQQRLEEIFFQTLRQLIAHHEQTGEFDAALRCALRATTADPLREEAHQEVMRLYASAGQPSAALRHYRDLERLLREQMDATPSDATRALADEIGRSGVQAFRRSGTEGEKGRRGEGESRQRRPQLPGGYP
jgi:DNA-binding SARP family transcriptional activator